MKIAYLLAEDYTKHSGLKRKIDGQIKRWVDAGHIVYKVLHYSGSIESPDGVVSSLQNNFSFQFQNKGKFHKLLRLSEQYSFAARALKQIRPDLTYSRYTFPSFGVVNIGKNAGKLVYEINSDDSAEYLSKNYLTGIFNKIFRHRVLRMAKGFIFVTGELANSKEFSSFSKIRTVIANGVECDQFAYVRSPENPTPQLGFIGSPGQSWHGIDKLLSLAKILPHCRIHVIGPSKQECEGLWGELPGNMVVYGYLDSVAADKIMASMDVGISSLALHRNGMNEACPLKVRQYLAQGLPVLAASIDTDFSEKKEFYFLLPNCENNVITNASAINDFIAKAHGNTEMREKSRIFASIKLSVDNKEAIRLKFFDQICALP